MKYSLSILLCTASFVALSCAFTGQRNADQPFLVKQKALLELLQHPHQFDVQPRLLGIANGYKIEENFDQYTNVDAVKHFVVHYNHGLIGHDELFTIYNPVHRDQVIALFHVFYYAKDWDSFYKSLVWARFNVNEGQFNYALTVALVHRQDLQGLELPAIYEINPHHFFNSEVIQRAQLLKQQGFHDLKKVEGVYNIIIQSNYTGSDVHVNDEQRLAYFTEDIGLNAYHYYFHIDYPFWLGGNDVHLNKDRRGEFYLYVHQQLLARYYLERLSNDLGHIKEFTWWTPVESGYHPHLQTHQGYGFSPRENHHVIYHDGNYYDVDAISTQEIRLQNAIDWGYALKPDGTHVNISAPEDINVLGNLIHGNPDSINPRYYRYLQSVIRTFGQSFGKDHLNHQSVYPTVLEHPETQLRDPGFWQYLKRVNLLWTSFYDNLVPYNVEQIGFEGVHVESLEVDKLITYFDRFDADITNAVDIEVPTEENASELRNFGRISHQNGQDFVIKARQWRLNHVPFKVTVRVASSKAVPSVVRVYLGPKYDDGGHLIGLNENRHNFVLLDVFKYDLVAGSNVIARESRDFIVNVQDRTSYFELYKWVLSATKGERPFTLENKEAHSGYPNRLLLPKGKKGGKVFKLFVHISPYHAPAVEQGTGYDNVVSVGIGSGARWVDSLPFGYPLERPIDELVWYTPNMYYHEVNIFHKKENEINRT
jgi:hypothetical protein